MALTVDKTVKYLNVPDANNFTFQCSKPMAQLSVDDVKSADFWVGFTSFAHNQMCEGNIESGLPQNDPNHCWCWASDPSALYEGDWSTAHWSFPANYPTGIYMRNIIVECASAHSQFVSLQNNASARIVLNIEAGEDTKIQDLFISGSSYITCPYSNENRVTDYRYIKPAVLMIVNGVLYVWIQGFEPYMSGFFCDSITSQGYRSSQSFDDFMQYSSHNLAMGWTRALETGDMYTDSGSTTSVNFSYTVPDVDFNGVTADLNVSLGATNYHKRASISITDNEDKEIEKWYTAFTGFKFKVDDVWYKPIVEGGIVTGYTDDMSVQSEWDEWDNITGHNVPSTGGGGDIKDKEHEMPLAYIGGSAGMVTFYEINKTGLASADDISEAVSRFDIAQIGKDLLRNFISYKAFAAINITDTVDRQIKIAGIPLEDSGGHALTGRVIGGVLPIDLFAVSHGVTIPTLYNDYRDYEPYTKIQMYVPFCGWFDLPSWCIGKKITGTMFTDLYNGTVKAVIKASDTVVAEVGGCCAYDIPFVADATGMKAGAVISSALTTAAAVGATVAMPNVATGIAAVSSAANLAATLNSNATTLKGVLGDGSNMNGLLHVYIKVSRPMSPNGSTKIPDSYKHEIGVPTMKEIKISAGDGYIQVMDAKVTGNMTAREKQMIIDGFRHGLNF